MAHPEDPIDLSLEERRFKDYIQKGDNFMKIQIYRSAKEWYTMALEMNQDHGLARSKLDNCNRLIQSEKKMIIIVVSAIAIVLVTVLLLSWL